MDILKQPETWIKCEGCAKMFGKLENGVCPDCLTKKQEKLRKEKWLLEELSLSSFDLAEPKTELGNVMAIEKMRDFNIERDNVFLWGPCGVGKSLLAKKLFLKVCQKYGFGPLHARYFMWPDFRRFLRMKEADEETDRISMLKALRLLIIDDLALGKDSETGIAHLVEVLEGRGWSNRGGLVITSNFNLDDLARKTNDDRTSSRIIGLCKVIEIQGKDYRLEKGGKQ